MFHSHNCKPTFAPPCIYDPELSVILGIHWGFGIYPPWIMGNYFSSKEQWDSVKSFFKILLLFLNSGYWSVGRSAYLLRKSRYLASPFNQISVHSYYLYIRILAHRNMNKCDISKAHQYNASSNSFSLTAWRCLFRAYIGTVANKAADETVCIFAYS